MAFFNIDIGENEQEGRGKQLIAVYVDEAGSAASVKEKGMVQIYDRENGEWKIVTEFPFNLSPDARLSEVRQAMAEMVQKISACRVFAAKEVVGQLYYILEANGFESFEAEGKPELFLESIQEEILQEKAQPSENEKNSIPASYIEPTDREGIYRINLKRALNLDCSLTSKKLLLSFLYKKEFLCLEVICDHIPKWFEAEFPKMGLSFTCEECNTNEHKVCITAIE